MYLESYMTSRVLDIPKYRANKDQDKINLVYFIRFIHYKLVSYDKQCLPHSSGERVWHHTHHTHHLMSVASIACHTKQVCSE